MGVDSLRAADEDLLQGNPGVFAIRHISAFGWAPGCEKCFKKRHAQSCVVSVIFPSGERWVIVKWLYKCTNGCRILFDNWMLLSCEETACEPVTRCYKTGMIWDVTTRGFHGSTGWQSVFAKWQFDAIWFSKGTSATLRRCYCKLRVNLGKFNAAKRLVHPSR